MRGFPPRDAESRGGRPARRIAAAAADSPPLPAPEGRSGPAPAARAAPHPASGPGTRRRHLPMKLTVRPPAWLRRVPRPPGGHALLAVPLIAPPLAADSIRQVISNTTLWIVGILAGLATLFLTLAGVRYLRGRRRPCRGREGQDRAAVRRDRLRPGDPRPGHRDRPEVPGRRMRPPRAPRRRPRRADRRAALLAAAAVLSALAAVTAGTASTALAAGAAARPAASTQAPPRALPRPRAPPGPRRHRQPGRRHPRQRLPGRRRWRPGAGSSTSPAMSPARSTAGSPGWSPPR